MFLKLNYKRGKMKHSLSTVFSKFSHIGEVKLFEFILTDMDRSSLIWIYDKEKSDLILKEYDMAASSQRRYLTCLVSNGVLARRGKGKYRVNDEWIDYGIEQK